MRLRRGIRYIGAEASERAICFHALNYGLPSGNRYGACVGFFSAAREVALTPSSEVEFRNKLVPRKAGRRGSLLNSSERNCERAEGDWQRQRPETEPDF